MIAGNFMTLLIGGCAGFCARELYRRCLSMLAARRDAGNDDSAKSERTYPAIMAVIANPEISTIDVPFGATVLFVFEGPAQGGVAIEEGIACAFERVTAKGDHLALRITAFGNPPDEHGLQLNTPGDDYDCFDETESVRIVPVRKKTAPK